jgi:hypothetical protein
MSVRPRSNAVALALCGIVFGLGAASPAPAADSPRAVQLQVVAHDGGRPIASDVSLQIWARDGRQATRQVAELDGATSEVRLPDGEYRVVATSGRARTVEDVVVSRADTAITISLDIGRVKLELLPGPGTAPVRDNVAWTVRRYHSGSVQDVVAETRAAVPTLTLSEGWYKVTADRRGRTQSHLVEVSAGRTLTYSLLLK